MRSIAAASALALLVAGCSDTKLPTVATDAEPSLGVAAAVATSPLSGVPNDVHPTMVLDTASGDSVPVLARIEQLMTSGLTQVPIPADGFSKQPDAVHPDVACASGPWNHARCWVSYTPYANSDPSWENPSFLTMSSDTQWQRPDGVDNPVVPWPGVGAYNSDPDQLFDPATGRLVTFFRLVSSGYNNIMAMSSADGRTWAQPKLAFKEENHNAVSPAVVMHPDRSLTMWYVQSGVGCQATDASVRMRTAQMAPGQAVEDAAWSTSSGVQLVQPGFVIWHVDVIPLQGWGAYVAIMASHPTNTDCSSDDLWLGISGDGVRWHTFTVPVLWRASHTSQQLGIASWYRAGLRYDAANDSLHVWPSALTASGHWIVFHTAVKLMPLVRYLLSAKPADQPTSKLRIASKVPLAIRNRMP